VDRLKELQLDIHETFIDMVKERRGSKLADDPDLFTGMFWTARKGMRLGLVDSIGDMRAFLKARYGEKTRMQLVTMPRGLFGRRVGILSGQSDAAPEIAAAAAEGLIDALEQRQHWNRFGL
jgi:ClpP class serine protease